jgi:hypothetical protein
MRDPWTPIAGAGRNPDTSGEAIRQIDVSVSKHLPPGRAILPNLTPDNGRLETGFRVVRTVDF